MESKDKKKLLYDVLLATIIWVALTIVYIALAFFMTANDWGDAQYDFNARLLLHDQNNASLLVGVVSGAYIVLVAWTTTKLFRGNYKIADRLGVAIFVIAAITVAWNYSTGLINGVLNESIHPSTFKQTNVNQ